MILWGIGILILLETVSLFLAPILRIRQEQREKEISALTNKVLEGLDKLNEWDRRV